MPTLPTIVDLVLAVFPIEAALLWLLAKRWRRLLPNLCAGFALLLALRCAVGGNPPECVLACLALGGIAHGWDLWTRLRGAGSDAG